MSHVLSGPIEPQGGRRLWEVSGGNPLFLRELVLHGQASGALVQRDGVWRWTRAVGGGLRLTELVGERLSGPTSAQAALVELLALAEPIDAAVLVRGAGHATALGQFSLAQRLALAAGDGFPARLAHARALAGSGQAERAAAELAALEREPCSGHLRARLAIAQAQNAFWGLSRCAACHSGRKGDSTRPHARPRRRTRSS